MSTDASQIAAAAGPRSPGRHVGFRLALTALAVWPFLYFSPVAGIARRTCLGIGNDFSVLYYNYKVYLLDNLSRLRLPLWSPSEGAGFPFYSSPFTQSFYPLNVFLAAFYRLAGGYSALDHQRFTVLGVSILCVGLFVWLRSLGLPDRAAFVGSAVLGVSFKVGEILRFPNALHAAAWYPWILWATGRVVQAPSWRQKIGAAGLLGLFATCLLTAGYPYYVFYVPFLVGPYMAALLWLPLATRLQLPRPVRPLRSALLLAAGAAGALGLCSPYLLKMLQLLDQTVGRQGASFAWATYHRFTPEHTLGSLLYPPASQPEGWYYFSVLGLLLAALYLASGSPGSAVARVFFLAWIAFVSAITYGRDSPLFRLAWEIVPGFSRLRVWGRLNIVLVPILAWLLARAYVDFESLTRSRALRWLGWLSAIYLGVLAGQAYFFAHRVEDFYWWKYLRRFNGLECRFLWFGLADFVALAALLALADRLTATSKARWAVALALVGLAAADMSAVGSRMWTIPRAASERRVLHLDRAAGDSLGESRQNVHGTIMSGSRFSVGVEPDWYFQRYVGFLSSHRAEQRAVDRLLGVTGRRRLFFTRSIEISSVRSFLEEARPFRTAAHAVRYDGDTLVVDVDAPEAGYLSFIDNWDPDWQVQVDGSPACVQALFGTFKAAAVPAGRHRVEFSYRPRLWRRQPCSAARP